MLLGQAAQRQLETLSLLLIVFWKRSSQTLFLCLVIRTVAWLSYQLNDVKFLPFTWKREIVVLTCEYQRRSIEELLIIRRILTLPIVLLRGIIYCVKDCHRIW